MIFRTKISLLGLTKFYVIFSPRWFFSPFLIPLFPVWCHRQFIMDTMLHEEESCNKNITKMYVINNDVVVAVVVLLNTALLFGAPIKILIKRQYIETKAENNLFHLWVQSEKVGINDEQWENAKEETSKKIEREIERGSWGKAEGEGEEERERGREEEQRYSCEGELTCSRRV